MNFIQVSLKHRQVTLTVLLMAFITGIYSLFTMPRREDPKITIPNGLIIAYYPGATAAQVEEQLTKKIEQYLFEFEEVNKSETYSTTQNGAVVVNVKLNDNVKKTDIFWNKLRHQLLVARNLDLPQGVRGPIVNSDFGDTEALLIAVESDDATYDQLTDYCQLLEDKIRTLPEASKIKRIGEQQEQITVAFNNQSLSQYGISLQQVVKVLQSENQVTPTGKIDHGALDVSLYAAGTYHSINEVENQIIGTSNTGAVVRLGDIATLTRAYTDPTEEITVNGEKAIVVTVQMLAGNNIVNFGQAVSQQVEATRKILPSNIHLTTIVNQPQLVDTNVSHFLWEFVMAIVSVVLVLIVLLPFNMAAIAATAIPMTVAVTFSLLNVLGIELHQVSLAALIVVLGMIVDDAIVVADNYLALLEQGLDRWNAAWRSASDLVVPILGATITIMASFMPMVILTGSLGEFIRDLPITVTLAFTASFLVSMFFTPILCYLFVKEAKTVAKPNPNKKKSRRSMLDWLQLAYNKTIIWCVKRPVLTISLSLSTIILAALIFKLAVGQRFFPYAERNQFVVEIWTPTGTKLAKTKTALAEVENIIKGDDRVTSYASFAGRSAPRVYYNFAPEFPVTNYGQILINTTGNDETETMAHDLEKKVANAVPEGIVQVKLMQQGQPQEAPVEIRFFGDDINTLKRLGQQAEDILKNNSGSYLVGNDFKEDYYGISIQLKEDAKRLGFTTNSIAQVLYVNTNGYAVSTMYEGDDAINIVLQQEEGETIAYQDLENIYMQSPVTGASVPLRQIATLTPTWQPGRIRHRNGVRCFTIKSETQNGVLPADLLAAVRPKIEALPLPVGYHIEYGGEYANKAKSMGKIIGALGISLVLIFLILLIQFQNLKELIIVMSAIPLSLFGAFAGLAITGSNFGFTAFVGLISLSGIVVRNAIILLDQTNELIAEGQGIRDAAIEAGKRRLRPIFLTTMSTSLGLLPMILSGSSMWAPLASVIAFGVCWSMLMALLTVPVLYVMMVKKEDKQPTADKGTDKRSNTTLSTGIATVVVLCIVLAPQNSNAQQQVQGPLTLEQAQDLALQNNHYLKIKELQVAQKKQKVIEDKVKLYPSVSVKANYQYNTDLPSLTVAEGLFGQLPLLIQNADNSLQTTYVSLPSENQTLTVGDHNTYNASISFYQPLLQISKIKTGVAIDKTDLAITEVEKTKAEMQLKQGIEKLYYGLLILQKQQQEAQLRIAAAAEKLKEVASAVHAGKAQESAQIGLHASLADEQRNLLKVQFQIDDYTDELKQLTGLPDSTSIQLSEPNIPTENTTLEAPDSLHEADLNNNTDLKLATLQQSKADYATKATNQNYIPSLGIIGGHSYQQGNALYPVNNTFIGASFSWNIQDMFSNSHAKQQTELMEQQAQQQLANTQEKLANDLSKVYRHLSQALALINTAEQAVDYRKEDLRIRANEKKSGLNTSIDYLNAQADLAKAEADLYAAKLNYRMAYTEILILKGVY